MQLFSASKIFYIFHTINIEWRLQRKLTQKQVLIHLSLEKHIKYSNIVYMSFNNVFISFTIIYLNIIKTFMLIKK